MTAAFESFSKAARFADLVQSVQHCDLCPRLCSRRKVLSPANGSIESKVLFVAEAPGRLGADRTGVPLYGDRTGDNFEKLLGNVAWRREQVFITNAILCNPQDGNGNNGTPTPEEVANCSAYLEMVIGLVQPDVIVTLGATALDALATIAPHGLQLREHAAQVIPWGRAKLVPLYHPGPRAIIHRSLAKQRSDFMRLAQLVHPVNGILEKKPKRVAKVSLFPAGATPMQQVARTIVDTLGTITYFKLTKLLYLVDLLALERLGHTVASDIYLRQADGPWPPNLDAQLKALAGHELRRYFARGLPMVAPGPAPRCEVDLDDDILDLVAQVLRKYGQHSNAQIKTAVYLTAPMRYVLREEDTGRDMRRKPVIYRNQTAPQLDAGNTSG